MAVDLAKVHVDDSLQRLNATIAEYLAQTGKEPSKVLADKGQWVSINLYRAFSSRVPRHGAIRAAAEARGWRMGRKDGSPGGISKTAWKRADKLLGGYKSLLFPKGGDPLMPIRASKRSGKRISDRSGKRSFAVSGKGSRTGQNQYFHSGLSVIGRYALAVAQEVKLREQGRRFLGVSWLHRRWRSFAREGFVPRGTPGLKPGFGPSKQFGGVVRKLVNNNPRSTFNPLGTAEFMQGEGFSAIRLVSNVPGVDSAMGQGIIARVLNEEMLGMQTYLLSRAIKQVNRLGK